MARTGSTVARAAGVAVLSFAAWAQATDFLAVGDIRRGLPPLAVLDEYEVTGFLQAGGGAFHDEFGPGETSWHAQADSLADIGGVRAHTYASIIRPSDAFVPAGGQYNAGVYAVANFTDFFIEGTPGTTTPGRVRLHVHGSMGNGTSAGTQGRSLTANTTVGLTVNVPGASDGGSMTLSTTNGTPTLFESGMLTGFDGDETLVTVLFNLPVGEAFTLSLILSAVTNLNYNSDEPTFSMQGNVEFQNTVTFATDGPAFELPAGFTINAPSAGIVDNRYVVPGPGALGLLGAGALAAAGRRRR